MLVLVTCSVSKPSFRNSKKRLHGLQAKPIIEKGAAKELLDPNISGTFVEDQFQKMVLAAKHCLTRAATHRPNIREVNYTLFVLCILIIPKLKCWLLCYMGELGQELTFWSLFSFYGQATWLDALLSWVRSPHPVAPPTLALPRKGGGDF